MMPPPRLILLLAAAGLATPAWALGWLFPPSCSSYQGRVVINEFNYQDNFVELKILDSDAQSDSQNFDSWQLRVYIHNRTTNKTVKDAVESQSCGASSGTYLRFNFAANELDNDAVVRLSDKNGKDVDLLRLGQNSLPSYYTTSCTAFPYDTTAPLLGSSANKDIARVPDGTGDWAISAGTGANSSKTPCASNSDTGGGAPAKLNAVDTGANAVTGRITTKTAGSAFSLDLYALNSAGTAQDTSFNGALAVDLLASISSGLSLDANGCPIGATSLAVGTAILASGKASVSMGAVADAWREVRVRLRYPSSGTASVTACSADNFAVKPAALAAQASDADWATAGTARSLDNTAASGGVVHKAGRPFTLRLSATNAVGAATANYDGSPAASLSVTLPAGGIAGALDTGAYSSAGGTLTSTTASYGEVGVIAASFIDTGYAAVDAADTAASCAGYHVCSGAVAIGRFVPDHFDLTANTPAFAPGCGSFTYLGQPFGFGTAPLVTVTAKNAAGATTTNYAGSLWKLAAATVTGQAWSAASGTAQVVGSLPDPVVSELGLGVGSIAFAVGDPSAGGGLRIQRAALQAPFDASLSLAASIADSEGVAYAGNPWQLAGVGFDDANAATTTDAQMRFGRLRLAHAHGSELRPLPLPATAQYWDGQGFRTNSLDYCTALAAPTLTFYPQSVDNQLASGETTSSHASPLVAGSAGLRLSAPGAGNHGYLDLAFPGVPAWLLYNWDGVDQGGDGDLHDDAPRARASFGRRRGADKVIIRRETY